MEAPEAPELLEPRRPTPIRSRRRAHHSSCRALTLREKWGEKPSQAWLRCGIVQDLEPGDNLTKVAVCGEHEDSHASLRA
jgi:hypothetical protein